ncbi:hypothetical protein M23134_01887 [Microscilla marina ATCC 23134]|uniref:Uncharacterized protein n=1 Tax=Microscilla marina ATCC 23134 TaxID=313606 RepID=A1ZC56_MICM2|nr:hypothetical protein M23134_01887 [Microscilla marina ATCC 23134]
MAQIIYERSLNTCLARVEVGLFDMPVYIGNPRFFEPF